jgi:hypothetical protein
MVDAVEPLSIVLWGVFFLAAGMYPLGFMLGAPCSPCCNAQSQCGDEPIEFNRCIRFVNTDTSPPPTTYAAGETVSQPLHGFSRAVTRPEHVGARRVGTKADLTARILLLDSARSMSDGETQSATYRYLYLRSPTLAVDLGTAKQWNVTLVGVTRPLTMPTSVSSGTLQYLVGPFANNSNPAREYSVGVLDDSTSAPVSVAVHSVAVLSGGEFIDGNSVTDATLKAMLTATIPLRNQTTWVTRLAFAATNEPFQYVPFGTWVTLEYVIKHSRGSQDRFRKFEVRVFQTGASTPIPAGGIAPLNLSQPPYADTPYSATPATYSADDPDAVTLFSSDVAGVKVLKTVEVVPVGEQMRNGIYVTPTAISSHLSLPNAPRYSVTFTEFGYIMRPFDPGGGYVFDSVNHPADSPWNYNVAEVEAFLAGGYTLPYSSGTTLVAHNNTWTMEVKEPTQFCGSSICSPLVERWLLGDSIERTVTVQTAPFPASYQSTDEKGTTTVVNPCHGQDSPPLMPLRISPLGCNYAGEFQSCENINSNSSFWTRNHSVSVRTFYCGDLLWAIENGPCRNTLTIPYLHWGNETYSLGGDDSSAWLNHSKCAIFRDQNRNACTPAEATASLDDLLLYSYTFDEFDFSVSFQKLGDLSGDCVFAAVSLTQAAFLCGPIDYAVPGIPTDCLTQAFSGSTIAAGRTLELTLFRTRANWCSPWGEGILRPKYCGPFLAKRTAGQPDPPSTFGSAVPLLPADTVSVEPTIVPAAGGLITLTYCCPERVVTELVPANNSRFDRELIYETQNFIGKGTTAYVTQSGQGNNYCPFAVEWLSNSTGFPGNNRMFVNPQCPIKAQISHFEQPGCGWSVTSSERWLIAESQDGLLNLSISFDEPIAFSGSLDGYFKPFRSATITITSGATVTTWTIFHLQP